MTSKGIYHMAIITDPDLLSRYDVIFGTESQTVSIYPVGETQRGTTVTDAYVSATGTITSGGSSFDAGVIVGDVVAVLNSTNAGHYFVETDGAAASVGLADIDTGIAGAQIASLTANQKTQDATAISADVFTLAAHLYVSGDAIVYSGAGGGTIAELAVGTVYYIIWLSASTFSLATSFANSLTGTAITIGAGTGVAHTFDDRLLVGVFNNGASSVAAATTPTGEFIAGNETTGDGDGDVRDGISMQAAYSYGKDQFRVDGLITDLAGNYNDDLIRTEFPFEAITSEQFEVGGGTAHDNWTWFNAYTRKKVRTGGWADKTRNQVGAQDLERWTGIVTLGSLDIDTQVYYQQVTAVTAKNDFTFTGVVNESVQILDDPNQDGAYGDGFDRTTYLKLFARKKGRSYAQSEIADIGVNTLQTIVNRFPLTHTLDTAITITDAQIFGSNPYKFAAAPNGTGAELTTGTDGDKTLAGFTFSSAGSDFITDNVAAGDILRITEVGDLDLGYYTIVSVDNLTTLTVSQVEYIDADGNFVFNAGWQETTSGTVDFDVYSSVITASIATGATTEGIVIETGATVATGTLGSLTDTTNASFVTDGVAAGDLLIIESGVTDVTNVGVYVIVDSNYDANAAAPTASKLFVNTIDSAFPGSIDDVVTYRIVQPGMYLQFKDELTETKTMTGTANEEITFAAAGRTLTLGSALTVWDATIAAGTMIVVEGTLLNDGRFTVLTRDSDTVITLISTDTVFNEASVVGTAEVREGFKRTIGTGTFAYRWRVSGNNGSLQEVFQLVQNQLRSTDDIDFGDGTAIGNITNLLMTYASPTGTSLDMFIDSLSTTDINNATFQDHSVTNRNFPFTASGSLVFNSNLQGDSDAKYWLFFSNDNDGDNLGRDFGTKDAIIVQDADDTNINGNINGTGNHTGSAGSVDAAGNISIPFTYDYDVNAQRGPASAAQDAPVTLVALGLTNAQYVIAAGTITRATGITISAVAALERNYLQGTV
jgi:hypothetical protein